MSSMNSMRLRELIRSVRQCKTAAEERSLINRECADIRQAFKENTPYLRTRNMLKLLYIHMLGYPTEFGQLEVVNLISQTDFAGKRIGYLALQLLLGENDEVLTLSENRMKSDMGSGNPLIQTAALHAAANVASEDMSRDIFDEIMKLVSSHNPYIRKKACLAALRIVRKVPEHAEYFLDCFTDIFGETHSSTLMCGLTLVNYSLQVPDAESFIPRYRKLATAAVRVLKALVLSSRVTEADVGGITDPFLQVKVLQFMRVIGKDSGVTSEALNDVLAQVITNTDATRNVGCAVHYECVRTIDSIESDEGLRTLAVNTIGRFLASSRDNNLRFVALQTLLDYAKRDVETVQQHQGVILECLKDVDISIRRRALDLTVALITESNVRLLVPDLLTYLSLCSEEMREDVTLHICRIIEEKSPSDEWRVDLSLKLLKLARNHAPVEFATRLVALLSHQARETQARAVAALWEEASYPFDAIHQARKAFLVAALWSIGEYAEHLIVEGGKISASDIAASLSEKTTNSVHPLVKQYGLTALMKVATRHPEAKEVALRTYSGLLSSLDCELQQRAREYTMLLTSYSEEAAFCFSRMPPIQREAEAEVVRPVPVVSQEMLQRQTASALDNLFDTGSNAADGTALPQRQSVPTNAIDDLFGEGGGAGGVAAASSSPVFAPNPTPASAPHGDSLGDLFGGGGSRSGAATATAVNAAPPAPPPPPPLTATPASSGMEQVFACDDFTVSLAETDFKPGSIDTNVVIASCASSPMEDVSCLLATLKTCTLTSSPLTSRVLAPHSPAVIHVHIDTSNETRFQGQLKLRIVLSYTVNGQKQERQVDVSSQST